jgi:hypothetical protein
MEHAMSQAAITDRSPLSPSYQRHRLEQTLLQRFGSALNLNVHFHMLFLDGVYTTTPWGKSRFHRTNAPDRQELTELVRRISHRVAGYLS